MSADLKRILFVILSDPELLDIAGPEKVFRSAARCLSRLAATDEPYYAVEMVSPCGGPVRTSQGVSVETSPIRELAPGEYDTIIVVGGRGAAEPSRQEPDWLQRNHLKARRVSAVRAGAFVLAQAGLLDGRSAVTHWMDCDALQMRYPAVRVDRTQTFQEDDGVWTAGGMGAGIDMALAMVEADHGRALAQLVARGPAVFQEHAAGYADIGDDLGGRSGEGQIPALLRWIADNPSEDLRTERLAERANMSLRNFHRAFVSATGESPAHWVKNVRLEIAKHLLVRTSRPIEQVAWEAGFASYQRMRRAVFDSVGIAPGEYRARFSSSVLHPAENNLTRLVAPLDVDPVRYGIYATPLLLELPGQRP